MKQLGLIILAAALLPGCSLPKFSNPFPSYSAPQAKVTAVKVTQQTDEGTRVEVTLELHNPNDLALPLLQTKFEVSIAGGGSFSFDDPADRTLPANGVQTVVLPAAFKMDRPGRGSSYQVHGGVTYYPPGQVRRMLTEMNVPLPTADFQASGKLE